MSEVSEKQYLTTKQVAEMLDVAEKTVYAWAEEGKIPSYKFGRLIRFDRDDIIAFINKSRQEEKSEPRINNISCPEPMAIADSKPNPEVTA